MTEIAKINPDGGPVTWSIKITHLKMAVYKAILFDPSNQHLQVWDNERTDDSKPDSFTVQVLSSNLDNCGLYWKATVGDPAEIGGEYSAIISIMQDGILLENDSVHGSIPPGKGMTQTISSVIKFSF